MSVIWDPSLAYATRLEPHSVRSVDPSCAATPRGKETNVYLPSAQGFGGWLLSICGRTNDFANCGFTAQKSGSWLRIRGVED